MTEREKMLAGGWFDPRDAELTAIRDNATRLMHRLNVELCGHDDAYRAALRELCPGCEGFIREPFRCDYGLNISIGEGSFVNFDCVFLDLAPIRIGRHTLIGPKVQLLTALHPFDAAQRRTGLEAGRPITVGDDCWLGGGVVYSAFLRTEVEFYYYYGRYRRRSRRDARHPGRLGGRGKSGARDPHADAAGRNRIAPPRKKSSGQNSFSPEIFYFCRNIEKRVFLPCTPNKPPPTCCKNHSTPPASDGGSSTSDSAK